MTKETLHAIFLGHFVPITPEEAGPLPTAQIVEGQWYAPLGGCDTLGDLLEDIMARGCPNTEGQ